jgi:hypothetical protein
MTAATTTTMGTRRRAASIALVRRLARGAGAILAAIGARWNDFVDAGQLGPGADSMTSRHTGARI